MKACPKCGSRKITFQVQGQESTSTNRGGLWDSLKAILRLGNQGDKSQSGGLRLYSCSQCGERWLWAPPPKGGYSRRTIEMFQAVYGPRGEGLPRESREHALRAVGLSEERIQQILDNDTRQ